MFSILTYHINPKKYPFSDDTGFWTKLLTVNKLPTKLWQTNIGSNDFFIIFWLRYHISYHKWSCYFILILNHPDKKNWKKFYFDNFFPSCIIFSLNLFFYLTRYKNIRMKTLQSIFCLAISIFLKTYILTVLFYLSVFFFSLVLTDEKNESKTKLINILQPH